MFFSINLPQAAVLGMHTIKEKPVVVNGQIVIRPIMVVALTYDHRLLDGREAVTFLGELFHVEQLPTYVLMTLCQFVLRNILRIPGGCCFPHLSKLH